MDRQINVDVLPIDDDPSITYSYDRIDEVKKECGSVLSSASELKSGDNLAYRIKNELAFLNGDWEQEEQGAPILPFDDKDIPQKDSDLQPPLKLVSFWVTNVDHEHRSKKTFSVSGMMSLGITRNGSFAYKPYERNPQFQMWPGHTQLMILFQGVYFESEKDGGERGLCLLGNTMLPSRQKDSTDPWEWVKGSNYYQPPLLQEDQISVVLRYPRTLTLTRRAIRGELKSLNQESNLKYFNKLHISSQLNAYTNYEYGSERLVSKACDPYPHKDELMDGDIEVYTGSDFCGILERYTSGEGLNVVPHWRCNGTDEYCSRMGPFISGKAIKATDGGFNNVKLLMQDVRCEPRAGKNNSYSVRVSSVFRAVTPFENQFTAMERTGFSNMTLPAEGIWNSSSGQLCMIGCLGILVTEQESCGSRVCLYIPISFSIKQRSIVMGSISSINNKSVSYFPLSFEKVVQPSELWDRFSTSSLTYKYSKYEAAGAFLERNEPFDFRTVIKKSFLSYPTLEDEAAFLVSLSRLSEDLTLHVSAIPDPFPKLRPTRTSIQMEILSLGPLFGRYWSLQNRSTVGSDIPFHAQTVSTEKQLLLNVSAQLTLTGKPYSNFSMLFLEGLYDPRIGKMYLIGCRDVRATWKILFDSNDLESGLDCSIEVKLEYPPTTARWLTNPTAKITISSRRNDDDALHFSPVKLQTLPILYQKQREDILSRKGVEGVLRILTLSLAISCILSQLLYIRDKSDAVPYMSIIMLGVQALGYSLPLITGAEAIFKQIASVSSETPSYDLESSQWFHVIDYTVKILILVAFLLTLRLGQKVWKSRIRLLTRTPLEPGRVPSDRKVFFTCLVIHTVGFILVLIVHAVNARQRPLRPERYIDPSGNSVALQEWETELEEYVGLIQDFFLLPQIVGNLLWQIHCKPLRKFYYMGITSVRLLPHIYDYWRAPVFNPYFSEEYEFVNPTLDFYSKFGDVAIPVIALVLAILVFIQQRWTYEKLRQAINSGQRRLLPLGSKVYERLPSVSFEAELVSGTNESVANGRKQENEE
ncbi:Duf2921 family protein [Thalictrum thalictroides]|uniref:RING-type E3 ubiquitin transferase n=1 Tax=Thalictrum thalictroides TaxID=46969 RepID=A0A7J6V556_THATH|nr:Duf2921 family protein [Thalictrum thalictroides]